MLRRIAGALLALVVMTTLACAATILPPGETVFTDDNGKPLTGGTVSFYIPGTLTPKSTYKNSAATVSNTNPVTLDFAGRAIIFGTGAYRQIVKDNQGNLIWDQITSDPSVNNVSFAGTAGGTGNAIVLTDPSFTATDGQQVSFIASATNTGPVTVSTSSTGSPIPVNKNSQSGLIPLVGSEIVAGNLYTMVYSASLGLFVIINPNAIALQTEINVLSFGAKGDGTPSDTAAIRNALAAAQAAKNALVRFPCGNYYLDGTLNVTIANGAHIALQGSGQDCTVLAFHGNINGVVETFSDPFSTAEVNDLTMTTDQVGHGVALTWSYTGKSIFAYNQPSSSSNFTARGGDYTAGFIPNPTPKSTGVQYWNFGWAITNVSNINSLNYTFQGVNYSGVGVEFQGIDPDRQAIVFNAEGALINNCQTGVIFGEYVQGMFFSHTNIIGCHNGIVTGVGINSFTDVLDQLNWSQSSMNFTTCGICINDPWFNGAIITDSVFIATGPGPNVAIKEQGTGNIITGNVFGGPGPLITGVDAMHILGSSGNGNIIDMNQFAGFDKAIVSLATTDGRTTITNNQFASNTTDYSINASMPGDVIITDIQPRNYSVLPTCNAKVNYSSFRVVDSNTSVFYGHVAGGGNFAGTAICDGAFWEFH